MRNSVILILAIYVVGRNQVQVQAFSSSSTGIDNHLLSRLSSKKAKIFSHDRVSSLPIRKWPSRKQRIRRLSLAQAANNDNDNEKSVPFDANSSTRSTQEASNNNELTVSNAEDTPKLPSYSKIILFTLTTILIWISEPLLSLVDTTVVGLTQADAVTQVAALGPATTLIDSLQYMTYFLAMATTSQISKFLALKDYRQLLQTSSQILGVAALLGLGISATLWAFGLPLLANMIGSSQSPQLVTMAAKYCWIRASVAPLAVMGMVAESSCLANVDTLTPAIAVGTASIINVIGDVALSQKWGMQGAAVATALATAASASIMLRKVYQRNQTWRRQWKEEQVNGGPSKANLKFGENVNGSSKISNVVEGLPSLAAIRNSTNGASVDVAKANGKDIQSTGHQEKKVPFLSLPDQSSFVDLVKISGPMFIVMACKILCYGAMSVRATDYGVVNLAAHSTMMRIFFFFTCFGDSLSQAAQSFLPTAIYPKPQPGALKQMLKRFAIFATCVGLLASQASGFIFAQWGTYLTNDAAVVKAMARYAPPVCLSLLVHPFIMLAEGALIALRDFKNLIGFYTFTTAAHVCLLYYGCHSFRDLWRIMLVFQSIRVSQFGVRLIQKVRNMKEKPEEGMEMSQQQYA